MGKLFGIVVVILGLWASVEVYNQGTAKAFEGLFVRTGLVEDAMPGEERRVGERVRTKVNQSHSEAEARLDRMLAE